MVDGKGGGVKTCERRSGADTIPDVIHGRTERRNRAQRRPGVDNSAAAGRTFDGVNKMSGAGKHSAVSAIPRSRSIRGEPLRLERRSPVRGEAPVQRLKRASPAGAKVPSGPRIRSTGDRPVAPAARGKRPAERSAMS